jgi:hypothetical protein
MQDLTGPVWPAAILVGTFMWVVGSYSGTEVGEMRTPGLLLIAAGAASGIFRLARRRDGGKQSGPGDTR